ncbi:unnamed protein product [Rotaria magnacalcarata]|uniref:NAD(P)(+)--arginine ADP-ribosyltransferase n=6 Tax=Rotaria magnacalcarata TaxID=392030 RepID=A0A816QCY9_9BILA|nr:unnamed protein product [Rotaria magnacalcarata]CAF4124693.1 unnamed protein product [Rotaria magnacalcarata]
MSGQKAKSTIPKLTASGASGRTAPSSVMRPRRRMTQNYLIIWVDGKIDENTEDYRNTLVQLHDVASEVKPCTTREECVEYLNEIDDGKTFIISSGALGQSLVNDIHGMPKVDAMYIFCGNKAHHESWAKEWPKIRGVFTSIKPICESLKKVARHCDHDNIPMSFVSKQTIVGEDGSQTQNLDQLEPAYMYSMLFKDIILEIDEDDKKPMKALVAYCHDQGVSKQQLNYFQNEYNQKSAIWWYTENIFLYSMLNKALRSLDMEVMVKMGFFIRNLHRQLEQLHQEQLSKYEQKFVVYRGQGMVPEDFQHLVGTKGGLLSFNSFLSTSKDREVSMRFVQDALRNNTATIAILFIMTIDQKTISASNTPFAMIEDESAVKGEQEILFTMHTVFRVVKIKQTAKNSRLWDVQLTIIGDNDPQLSALTNHIEKEVQGSTGWRRMGKLMLQVGHFDLAEELYNELLENASTDSDRAFIYYELGRVKKQQGQYEKEIIFYEKSLEINEKILSANDPILSAIYNNIALAYQKMGGYSKALEFYERSLKIREIALPSNHPDLAQSYNNIGSVYNSINEYSKALEFHKKANKINQKSLPPNHPYIASDYNNIGLVYNGMGDYSKALEFYEKSLKIGEISLPSNHPGLATFYNNIGGVYDNMGEYTKALDFYEKDLEITKKTLPENHPDLTISYNNIGLVYKNMGEYEKALSNLEKALAIRRKSLPSTHPSIKMTIHNIELVKEKL